ncbi:hypothetical protein Leryth_000255 [Lithospermum erythrorhizon]|nr:hypothetical protein Leryth_000255 [Lithospermum erythrorhizon]
MDHFQYAIFCLLALMCFGDKLDDDQIKKIEAIQRKILLGLGEVNVLNLFPVLSKIIFRKQWKELLQLRQDQENILIPLIKARIEAKGLGSESVAYVDSLVDLQLTDEKRKLNMGEIVSICAEFFNAGTIRLLQSCSGSWLIWSSFLKFKKRCIRRFISLLEEIS